MSNAAERARILYGLGCAFAARLRLEELIPLVLAKCREILHAEGASVLLLDAEHDELYFPFVAGEDPEATAQLVGLRFPADRGIAGAVLRSGKALRVDDVATDPRFYRGVDRQTRLTTRALLTAPLTARDAPIGVIQVMNPLDGRCFTDDDLEFVEALAGSVAVAVDNARLYAQLQSFASELERKVTERTHELLQKNDELERTLEQLRRTQTQLIAQEKLASLGALTAGIAHEIKNPLNFVNNFAQLSIELADELGERLAALRAEHGGSEISDLDELLGDLKQNAAKIGEHGQRADQIVRGMLQHSRGASAVREPADVNALLAESIDLAYHSARARDGSMNVAIETHYDAKLGTVAAVRQDLSRVFLNLVSNACEALREKKRAAGRGFAPAITVRTANLGDRVEVRIRDNGPGIPPAIRDKVFEPFFTTKPAGQGTGLGLSISHDIVVQQHGGELRVETVEGEYAELIIILPRS